MKTPVRSHAPVDKVSPQGSQATQEAVLERNSFLKGQCAICQEVFNLRVRTMANDCDWQERDICPDCGEIFEDAEAQRN